MAFDYTRLRLGERIAGVCALLLFIDEFLDWYSLNIPGGPGASAWDIFAWVDLLMLLTVIVVLTWVALTGMQRTVALPVTMTTIAAALCAFTTLIVLYRIINQPGPNAIVNVEYGAYLGLLLLIGMTYGAYTAMRDEGSTFGEAGSRLRSAVESRTEPAPPRTTPAPPPPASPPPPAAPPAQAPPPPTDPPPPATA
ncbi:MAG: hypothetical protein JWN32_2210 [Solirubrobacterales bacterium]|nr:hypothetical protein [Solirubrobacterales bacterium]